MSLVYNNDNPIGKCESYSIDKVPGTTPFVMLTNYEPLRSELNENQQIVLEWLKQVSGTEGSLTRALYSLYHLNLVRKEYFDNLTIDTKEHQLEVRSALRNLSRKQEAQILAAFAEWGMKVVAE